ncbi:bifunctional DNA primase/polymerase [Microbacterium azadirachtae]|uniref:bifunctional DNA primase/polymerase n=1 Tax=Microbacterium azadirachtae TaxID=582680 RepID=UPI0021D48D58|nr:bifunctional DNA primase/polymerase [Microbacterium azadirachtae]UXW85105.1 bifunctional DNA primase/polymerase [Microbacterium azadirachtae]
MSPRLNGARSTKDFHGAPSRYAQHADIYGALGWTVIAVHGKKSPYKGTTGQNGEVTPELDAAMRRSDWHDNIAIRHTLGEAATVAIDVDEGDGKQGLTTLQQLTEALGELPVTWTSTARGQDDPRRQHFFRVPPGVELETTLTPSSTLGDVTLAGDIEIPSHGHRYSVVWPSVHPDTGEQYTWYDLDGQPMDGPPRVDDLPYLPDAWVEALEKGHEVRHEGKPSAPPPRPYDGTVDEWLGGRNDAVVSPPVVRAIQPYLDGAPFRGHHAMAKLQKHLVLLGGEGHQGVRRALEFIRAVWLTSEHTPGENPAREFDDALAGAVRKYGGSN